MTQPLKDSMKALSEAYNKQLTENTVDPTFWLWIMPKPPKHPLLLPPYVKS